jgi:enamine deaminase RidA (YjgF/YER057c/UK114 family)
MRHVRINRSTSAAVFKSDRGVTETWILAEIPADTWTPLSCESSIGVLEEDYGRAMGSLNLNTRTLVHTKFFCTDLRQRCALRHSELWEFAGNGSRSIIEQPPLSGGGSVSLLAYHIGTADSPPKKFTEIDPVGGISRCDCRLQNYSVLMSGSRTGEGGTTYDQTTDVMEDWSEELHEAGLSMLGNGVRTWIHVSDIDREYGEMVRARARVFMREELNPGTRFLASTGIEAGLLEPEHTVSMDALAIGGIKPSQISRMWAPGKMGAASDYGVTFDRGTAVTFGDRKHFYISGTASIDESGAVVYPGNAGAQALRAVENLSALLQSCDASLGDIAIYTVYLRNIEDYEAVRAEVRCSLPSDAIVHFTRGKVCRPDWLVEIEGTAITTNTSNFPPLR